MTSDFCFHLASMAPPSWCAHTKVAQVSIDSFTWQALCIGRWNPNVPEYKAAPALITPFWWVSSTHWGQITNKCCFWGELINGLAFNEPHAHLHFQSTTIDSPPHKYSKQLLISMTMHPSNKHASQQRMFPASWCYRETVTRWSFYTATKQALIS